MFDPVKSTPLQPRSYEKAETPPPALQLSETQIEIIDVFVHLLHTVGLPKSAGEIYGLLFTSAVPLTSEEMTAGLNISGGSVSQGLRLLRSLGAVRTAYVAGDRRDHYVAEVDLRKIVAGFLRDNIEAHLTNGEERLSRLNTLLSHDESMQRSIQVFLGERVEMLRTWNQRARAILPMLLQGLH